MLVNARSSIHEPNQEVDRDLKRLSDRDSLLCEQAPYHHIDTHFYDESCQVTDHHTLLFLESA